MAQLLDPRIEHVLAVWSRIGATSDLPNSHRQVLEFVHEHDRFVGTSAPQATEDLIANLAERYQVSRQAMTIRLTTLGFLSLLGG